MKSIVKIPLNVMVSMLILLISMFLGCTCGTVPASDPIEVNLLFSGPPVLNKPVQVTSTFRVASDHFKDVLHDVEAHIYLTDGFQLIEGSLDWQGDLLIGQTHTIRATVKSVKLGIYVVSAAAFSETDHARGSKRLYVTVTEKYGSTSVSDQLPMGVRPTVVQTDPPPGYRVPDASPVKPHN